MDLHPIIVHFPIALLTVYAVFELVRFPRIVANPHWQHTKAVLAIFGELSAFAALMSAPGTHRVPLIEMHQKFAMMTVIIFGIISIAYLLEWLKPSKYSKFIMKSHIIIPLAFLGLIAIVITGGLGGAIVYGTNFDPLMAPIFKLLGVY